MPRFLLPALALTLTVALAACDFEQVIELDTPPYEPRLVLGGFPTPDSAFAVRIGRSTSALALSGSDPFDLRIPNARVILFDEDGVFLDSLRFVEPSEFGGPVGLYRSVQGLHPEPGRAYTLRADAPGLPPAEATTRLPNPVPLDARIVRINDPMEFGERSARLAVTVPDPPGPQTYALTVALRPDFDPHPQPLTFRSSDPSLRESFDRLDVAVDIDIDVDPGLRFFYGRAIFRDGLFAGAPHEIELDAIYYEFEPDGPPPLAVSLSTLSDDYVRYQQTLALQNVTGDNPFAEPVRIHSNVTGGLGVFAGYTSSTVMLDIE